MPIETGRNRTIIFSSLISKLLAGIQHAAQRRLLRARNSQLVIALDVNPRLGVRAVEAGQRGLPLVGAAVALGAVGARGDGPELRAGDVVGEGLALGGGPG